jgi:hypothetical protein
LRAQRAQFACTMVVCNHFQFLITLSPNIAPNFAATACGFSSGPHFAEGE